MSDEIKNPAEEDLFADLGAELGIADVSPDVTIEEEEFMLTEDLDGFAKGFPDWDLLPPKKK